MSSSTVSSSLCTTVLALVAIALVFVFGVDHGRLGRVARECWAPSQWMLPVACNLTQMIHLYETVEADEPISSFSSPLASYPTKEMAVAAPSSNPHYAAFQLPAMPGEAEGGKGLHVTICYMHYLTEGEQLHMRSDLETLRARVLPLTLRFGDKAMFGAEKTIPVQLVTIAEPTKEEVLREFNLKWARKQPGRDFGDHQSFHVTLGKLATMPVDSVEVKEIYLSEIKPRDV